jgi:hypothetical protein
LLVLEVDIELARKFFAQKFSCGCSKSADDELTIQGDVVSELIDLLPEKWNQVFRFFLLIFNSCISNDLLLFRLILN